MPGRWEGGSRSCSVSRFREPQAAGHRGLDRARGRLAEAADGCVAHPLPEICEQPALAFDRSVWLAPHEARHQLLLADGADAARHTLTAALLAEKACDALEHGPHGHRVVEHQHHARSERRARLAGVLEGQLEIEIARADEGACGTTEEDGLELRRG